MKLTPIPITAVLASLLLAMLAGCSALPDAADPASDAPEGPRPHSIAFKDAPSYAQALQTWRTPEDVNAWIGAKFRYDMPRAMRLSESQRTRSGPLPIHAPHAFFLDPSGVCVDLSRFAVETLRQLDPQAEAGYLMIEFSPVMMGGHALRRHWVAFFVRDGGYYVFADSKRPGVLAGPYAGPAQFIAEYAAYRKRQIVAFRELASYERKLAAKRSREARSP